MELNKEVSQRMNMLRFLMIVGVVILHTPPQLPLGSIPITLFDHIKAFFQGALFRTTVPILTFISAYLIFLSGLDRKPLKLYEKKFYSLVVPFIVFNLGLLGATYICQRYLNIHILLDLTQADAKRWINAAFGLTHYPINYPLHFLRNLVVLVLFAPLMGMLLRRAPYIGLALIFCIAHFNLEGYLLLRNNMLLLFYMGGMAALLPVNMLALDKYRVPALIIFCVLCIGVVIFHVKNINYFIYASPFLVWPAASLLSNTQFGAWARRMSPYSFFIFLAHAPVLAAAVFVYRPFASIVPYPVFWVVAPIVIVSLLVLIWKLLNVTLGPVFAMATGCYKKKRTARSADSALMETGPAVN